MIPELLTKRLKLNSNVILNFFKNTDPLDIDSFAQKFCSFNKTFFNGSKQTFEDISLLRLFLVLANNPKEILQFKESYSYKSDNFGYDFIEFLSITDNPIRPIISVGIKRRGSIHNDFISAMYSIIDKHKKYFLDDSKVSILTNAIHSEISSDIFGKNTIEGTLLKCINELKEHMLVYENT